jgi:pyridoxal phosphate enzyme (YggS family)
MPGISTEPSKSAPDSRIAGNAGAVRARMRAACARVGRNPDEIRLVWVSKNHPRERLLEAHAAGARIFGENRVREALEKFPLPADPATGKPLDYELHLIGHLQRNKVRKILPLCTAIHSIDSLDLWQTVDRVAGELGLKRGVFLQINASREPQKSGFPAEGFLDALASFPEAPNLRVLGLMTMGPMEGGPEAARPCFRELRGLLENLRAHPLLAPRFPEAACLSMGMSGDFEAAIEEGAHFLRIGTALFGEREA